MRTYVLALFGLFVFTSAAQAVNTCTFTTAGKVMTLQGDCTTDASILIPAGYTLDGNGVAIAAVDPAGGHFTGAIVRNGSGDASVLNLTITTLNLTDVCDAGNSWATASAAATAILLFESAAARSSHTTT